MSKALLTIVVPTKNRQEYIEQVVDAFSVLHDQRIKLVIHDNSENELVSQCILVNNVSYIHFNDQISMHENFSMAIGYVDTPYMCIAGDDDFFTHHIGQILDFLEENEIDAIVADKVTRYWWGDVNHRLFKKSLPGQLRVPYHRKQLNVRRVHSDLALKSCFRSGGTNIKMLPKLYHGIVKTSVVRSLEEKYGSAFLGPTPDMSSAILLAITMPFFYRANLPFFVSGTAGNSAGGRGVAKTHRWKLEDTPWFDKRFIDGWHENTPREAIGPTLWAESVLQTCEAAGQDISLNWSSLYSKVLVEGSVTFRQLVSLIPNNEELKYFDQLYVAKICFGYLIYQLRRAIALFEHLTFMLLGRSWLGKRYLNCKSPMTVVELIRSNAKKKLF